MAKKAHTSSAKPSAAPTKSDDKPAQHSPQRQPAPAHAPRKGGGKGASPGGGGMGSPTAGAQPAAIGGGGKVPGRTPGGTRGGGGSSGSSGGGGRSNKKHPGMGTDSGLGTDSGGTLGAGSGLGLGSGRSIKPLGGGSAGTGDTAAPALPSPGSTARGTRPPATPRKARGSRAGRVVPPGTAHTTVPADAALDADSGTPDKDRYVYFFGEGKADGRGDMKPLLGGKGAGLAEMTRIGLPVPPGFTITTEVCTWFYEHGQQYPPQLKPQILAAMARLEKLLGKRFGDEESVGDAGSAQATAGKAAMRNSAPLLVAVRSGARDSMPGMMDTILNLGLNDDTVLALARLSHNERFAWDCYRRFIQMYGDVVMGVQKRPGEDDEPFEAVIHGLKRELFRDRYANDPEADVSDTELDAAALKELVLRFKALVKERTGKSFPTNAMEQLWGAIGAVFGSWNNERAIVYRHKYGIPAEWGTAVNVQAMVFGNTGDDSGSGVAFTRDPATGEKRFYGEYLINAQGEDVVAGVRTPVSVEKMAEAMPAVHRELEEVRKKLEGHFREMQDFEFTIENGKLYMLQTRNGKRTGVAAVRIAVEMVDEKLITWQEAVQRVPAEQLDQLLTPVFDRAARKNAKVLATGLPAGPGAATGRIYFNANEAAKVAGHGEKVLLVRVETSPEDIRGMLAAEGILTARGGVSSHAALVARQMGKVCVCGASALHVDYEHGTLTVGKKTWHKGDYLSIDGTSGEVFDGELKTAPSEIIQVLLEKTLLPGDSPVYRNYARLMEWADRVRTLGIRTNADQPGQVENAVAFGAEGVGLCRTEHMFFSENRIDAMREMILAETREAREAALAKLLPVQRQDFAGIFRALDGLPATIRLLDPPLHEFLPQTAEQQAELAHKLGMTKKAVARRVAALHEFNPMLGHRGCRLGITFPEISAMQARAIFEAALEVQAEGVTVRPEIMIPLVGFPKELEMQARLVRETADQVMQDWNEHEGKETLDYTVGTMIEIPRACLTADKIAATAEFFSFGTNDLTQTALGMSRDDSGSFLPEYQEQEITGNNPFATIDQEGVGELMRMAVEKGRRVRHGMKIGICGEHGGEPKSVKFCHALGLDYVSCSPFRVPIARLAAAQAALGKK